MARWIGVFCGLLIVNLALAQEYAVPANPVSIPVEGVPGAFVSAPVSPYAPPIPVVSELPHASSSPYPQRPPVAACPQCQPPLPVVAPPQYRPQQPPSAPIAPASAVVAYQPQPPQPVVPQREPLEIVVYEVADLVSGSNSSSDPNQAMLAMLAQQSEEFALMLNAAGANGGESQSRIALGELAETLESTFEDDFGQGRGTIALHGGTMSLIVRQTPAMHEQIRDLLTQLRRINNTSIQITLKLAELDEAHMAFAMSHNGQVLDEAALQQFNELNAAGEIEMMSFSVSLRNGQNTSLYGYGFPASLTAIATEDRRAVRVNLNMLLGLGEGVPAMQHNHRVPTGKTVLMTLLVEDEGYVVLLSADIAGSEEEEIALQSNTVAERESAPLIRTNAILAEIHASATDVLRAIALGFGGEPVSADGPAEESCALLLSSEQTDQLLRALQEDKECSVLSRPQILAIDNNAAQVQIGQVVPVVSAVTFSENNLIPIVEQQECGISLELVPTVTREGAIRMQLNVEQSEFQEEELILVGDIVSPIKDILTVETTLTIPHGQTLVWSVPRIGAEESTLLIILTSQVEQ